jgi:hypothetical protein
MIEQLSELSDFTVSGVKMLLLTFLCSFAVGVGVGIIGLLMVIDAMAKG